ncbi:hypothetical protein SAMN03080615_02973 [Amphritea atlantica]|uniref:Tetratricopeptide repeat-containing protein n=1 Tax=Amphritea atlantica TaxID=355243 RepID=A0A1H9JGD6_9GAMM|nr:hypothetical protein [Amphritea atlantica]SEQ85615.1 hypothetical protein SAMN03080615_02973 [Amphritea atlantica]
MKSVIEHYKYFTLLVLVGLLSGCAVTLDVDNMNDSYGDPDQLIKADGIPQQGYYTTRVISDEDTPNRLYNNGDFIGNTYVLDIDLELKKTANGNYYRFLITPLHLSKELKASWNPWLQAMLNFTSTGEDPKAIKLYAKLPDDLTQNSDGKIVTDWFICDVCTKGKTSQFAELANADSKSTHRFWYQFVQSPTYEPNWQGDMAAREHQITVIAEENKRRIEAIEAKMPPSVRRDKYMVQLSSYLKKQNYKAALDVFPKLESLPIATDPSLKYFYGEALLKTNQPAKAMQKLYQYINEQGTGAAHYARALEMINEAESQL